MGRMGTALRAAVFLLSHLLPRTSRAAAPTCPPPGFNSVQPFDLSAFISAPWYVQQQVTTIYTTAPDLYCVRAHYVAIVPGNLTEGVYVNNYSNKLAVNGPAITTSFQQGSVQFYATVPNVTDPSKLEVGPYFGANKLANTILSLSTLTSGRTSNLWVVATDSLPGNPGFTGYNWAILTTGAPTVSTPSGCRTGNGPENPVAAFANRGFWFFTRDQIASNATLDELYARAEVLGLDTTVLEPVAQEGCDYSSAP